MKSYHSAGSDLEQALRVIRFHNTNAMRALRATRGDVDLFCCCDMCNHSRKALEECNQHE